MGAMENLVRIMALTGRATAVCRTSDGYMGRPPGSMGWDLFLGSPRPVAEREGGHGATWARQVWAELSDRDRFDLVVLCRGLDVPLEAHFGCPVEAWRADMKARAEQRLAD